jgi:hypothetical protein
MQDRQIMGEEVSVWELPNGCTVTIYTPGTYCTDMSYGDTPLTLICRRPAVPDDDRPQVPAG